MEECVSDSSNHIAEMIELGVKELKELEGVVLFPNPTSGVLNLIQERIENGEWRIENVEVFDVYGRKPISDIRYPTSEIEKSEIKINISHLPAGIYFLRLTTEKGIVTKKVVKY